MNKLLNKRGAGGVLTVVLLCITAAAVMVAVVSLAMLSGKVKLPSLPRPGEIREAVSAPAPTPTEEPLTNTIALPQFAWLNLKADTTEQTLTFDNPQRNFAHFRVSLVYEDQLLWESELLAPGETSKPVVLSEPFPAGEYEILLCYTCFSDETAQNQLNGARSPVRLVVQ